MAGQSGKENSLFLTCAGQAGRNGRTGRQIAEASLLTKPAKQAQSGDMSGQLL
jgi:glycerol-3-phosphate dehydrogenase